MTNTTTAEYVRRCERADAGHEGSSHPGKWIIQTYHQAGMAYADEQCSHYRTRAEATAATVTNGEADALLRAQDRQRELAMERWARRVDEDREPHTSD